MQPPPLTDVLIACFWLALIVVFVRSALRWCLGISKLERRCATLERQLIAYAQLLNVEPPQTGSSAPRQSLWARVKSWRGQQQ